MKRKARYLKSRRKNSGGILILCGVAVALLLLVICMMVFIRQEDNKRPALAIEITERNETNAAASETTNATQTATVTTEAAVPPETTEPQILNSMAEYYAANQDTAGWIKIDGTKLDYPVMYTPNDPEKYLHLDFDGDYSFGGLPFIDANCSMNPESDNLIIYGHNMQNGTMFRPLISYEVKNFWQEHPTITFSTLYEEKEYEVVAAFYDRVYYTYEDCFKFYQFIDAEDKAAFNEAITYFKEHALYDTGVTAEYGDKLITLVTCAYHVDNGRFVVVARESEQP